MGFLPSQGLVATAGGNSVKIRDLIGGEKMVYLMESYINTVTLVCVWRLRRKGGSIGV